MLVGLELRGSAHEETEAIDKFHVEAFSSNQPCSLGSVGGQDTLDGRSALDYAIHRIRGRWRTIDVASCLQPSMRYLDPAVNYG